MVAKDCFVYEGGIIRADLRGIVTDETWSYVFCKTLALAGIHQTRNLLIDLRGAMIPVTALAIYNLPPVLAYIGLSRLYRIALVMDCRGSEYTLVDTVFRNQGLVVQMFTDYEEATTWLKPADPHLN